MATEAPSGKEVAGAVPVFVLQPHVVGVILSSEVHPEARKADAIPLLSVALGLLDLADETRLHLSSFDGTRQRKHRAPAAVRPVP
jgi:hypothetical protein